MYIAAGKGSALPDDFSNGFANAAYLLA